MEKILDLCKEVNIFTESQRPGIDEAWLLFCGRAPGVSSSIHKALTHWLIYAAILTEKLSQARHKSPSVLRRK